MYDAYDYLCLEGLGRTLTFKLIFIAFNLVPYIALAIMSRKHQV